MKPVRSALLAAALAAGTALSPVSPAAALPLSPAAAATQSVQADVPAAIPVSRSGRALTAGIIGGLIVGGLIASHWPYRHHYYYAPYPAYPVYPPYPVWRGPAWDAAIAYCIRRFRSYDPYTMTYLGYDGRRHPCPR